jgi:hypothetical protein
MTIFISLFLAALASVLIGVLAARSSIWSHGPLERARVRTTDDSHPVPDTTPLGWQPFDPKLHGRARGGTYAH